MLPRPKYAGKYAGWVPTRIFNYLYWIANIGPGLNSYKIEKPIQT